MSTVDRSVSVIPTTPPADATILIVGGADTGRAPMAVALLRQLLAEQAPTCCVASAGVTGHDDDPPEVEARDAMAAFGVDIAAHRARSISAELVQSATLLVAIDRGIAHVLRQYYPTARAKILTLSELAATERDIPDPFRMQVGAWMAYAHAMQQMLTDALPHLLTHLIGAPPEPPAVPILPEPPVPTPTLPDTLPRTAALARLERVLAMLHEMPDLLDWPQVQRQIEASLQAIASEPVAAGDLALSYTALLNTLVHGANAPLYPHQVQMLQTAVARLHQPIDQLALNELAALLAHWYQSPNIEHS
ncbi:MAG: hypothetical protein HC911_03315 [Chloroflexaceae bacterium]|nr:hypothetical protein [Chloroflexaceae bacterium]